MTYQKKITDVIDDRIYKLSIQQRMGSEGYKHSRNLDQSQLNAITTRIDELNKLKEEIIAKYGEI